MSDDSSSTRQVPLPPVVVEAVECLHWSVISCNLLKKPLVATWKERQEVPATIEELRAQALLLPASGAVVTGKLSNVVAFDADEEAGVQAMRSVGLIPHVQTGSGFSTPTLSIQETSGYPP